MANRRLASRSRRAATGTCRARTAVRGEPTPRGGSAAARLQGIATKTTLSGSITTTGTAPSRCSAAGGTRTTTGCCAERAGFWWDDATNQCYDPWGCWDNAAPIALLAYSCSGLSCRFDGGGSSDIDGIIVAYEWDFSDGATGSGASVQHAYAQAGSHTVTLTVTDDGGAVGSGSTTVAVTTLWVPARLRGGHRARPRKWDAESPRTS
jgi:hypothetical protein